MKANIPVGCNRDLLYSDKSFIRSFHRLTNTNLPLPLSYRSKYCACIIVRHVIYPSKSEGLQNSSGCQNSSSFKANYFFQRLKLIFSLIRTICHRTEPELVLVSNFLGNSNNTGRVSGSVAHSLSTHSIK